jgi:hypothetical protein
MEAKSTFRFPFIDRADPSRYAHRFGADGIRCRPKLDRSYVETRIAWNRVNNPSQLEELTRTDLLWP